MKALITGGAGFIGMHLSMKLIEKGYELVIADNFSRAVQDSYVKKLSAEEKVTLCSVDLLDEQAVMQLGMDFDYIYHLAAIIGVQNVLNHSYDVLANNAELLINIIKLGKKQKSLKRLIFASTSEVYAGTLQYYGLTLPTPEDTSLTITDLKHPRTSYMLSKIYGEALMQQSGLPFTIIRPHNFYGPRMGMSHVIPELLRKSYKNEGDGILEVFSADHRRTFCYIDDAIEMVTRLAETEEAAGETFNVGTEAPEYTMRKVGQLVLKVTDKPYSIRELPPSPGSPERRCPDMKKTEKATGYKPVVGLEEGIRRTFAWYKENIFDGKEICAK